MITASLRRVSVFKRIALLAGLGLVAVLLVSAFGFHARSVWLSANVRIMQLEELQRSIISLKLDMERGRLQLATFTHTPMEHHGERLKVLMADIVTQIDFLQPLATDSAMAMRLSDMQAIARKAVSQIEAAKKSQIALGATRNVGTRNDVHVAEAELEVAVRTELGNSNPIILYRIQGAVQSMIRFTERLMGERNTAIEAELGVETARIGRFLQMQQLSLSVTADLEKKLDAHSRAVSSWIASAAAFDADILSIDKAFTLLSEPVAMVVEQVNLLVASTRADASTQQAFDDAVAGAGALLVLIACGLMALLIARSVTYPLYEITSAMEKISLGQTEIELHGQDAPDEIGSLSRAAAIFRNEMVAGQLQSERTVKQAAERSARAAQVETSVGQFDHSIAEVLGVMNVTSARLTESSNSLDHASGVVAERTRVAQDATDAMTDRINMVAAATDELSTSIAAIASDTGRAAAAADGAISQVDQTEKRMQELLATSSQIGDVVILIRQIASQTNLLALNATIEAARAGESGRGFAIVASEVKTLAAQTQSATEEISRKIDAIQSGATNMSRSIQDMSRVVLQMREIAVDMASSIRQQDATVVEIASTMVMLAGDASVSASSVRETTEAAHAADGVAREVRETAASMREVASRLSGDVGTFIADVRAA